MKSFDNGLFGIDVTKRADSRKVPTVPQDQAQHSAEQPVRQPRRIPTVQGEREQQLYVVDYDDRSSEPER